MIAKAKRMKAFQPSVFTTLTKQKEVYRKETGKHPIDLSLGSPNIAPESSIMDVFQKTVMEAKNYKYAVQELPELHQAIQSWYDTRYQVELHDDEIICLQGSQEALVNLPLALCDEGDIVLVCDPYYPIFEQAPQFAGAKVEFMPLKEEHDYVIQLNEIDEEIAQKTKIMIVSYPNNPTGAIAPDSFYEELVQFAKRYNILVIHDNAYSELVFDGKVGKSFLSFEGAKDIGVELNSFSKTYGMAGARLGVLVGNQEVIQIYRELKSNLDYGIFLPVQYAGIEALYHGGNAIETTRQTYQNRRDLLIREFKEAGWDIQPSLATMFVWAKIPESYKDSYQFAKELLEKTGVIVTPGLAFGKQGTRYVRIALVQDDEVIQEAAQRIKQANIF